MAVLLPIEDVASSASITFLILFLLVNFALIRMRKTKPNMERPFRAPWVPWLQYLTIAIQIGLAVHLATLSPIAWGVTIVWLVLGALVYKMYGATHEAAKEQDTILLEETVAAREYSVLLPVASETAARQLAQLGALFAQANHGELFALNVVRVPHQLGIIDGRAFLRQGRPILEEVISVGREFDVPVRTMIRLGRDIGDSIISAAQERNANLMLLGWPGYTHSRKQAFGTIIDLISRNPPCDLAVVRFRRARTPKRILVPVSGGPNARMALEIAITQAESLERSNGSRVEVVALNLALGLSAADTAALKKQRQEIVEHLDIEGWPIEIRIEPAQDVVEDILRVAADFDQIVIGASEERLLEQSLFGSIPQRVAEESGVTVIMVKRHDMVKFGLRRWLMSRKKQ